MLEPSQRHQYIPCSNKQSVNFISRFLPKILAVTSRAPLWPELSQVLFGKQGNSCRVWQTALTCVTPARVGFVGWKPPQAPSPCFCRDDLTPHKSGHTPEHWKGTISQGTLEKSNIIYKFRHSVSPCLLIYKSNNSPKLSSEGRGAATWAWEFWAI